MKKLITSVVLSITLVLSSCTALQSLGLSDFDKIAGLREALTNGLFSGFDAFAKGDQGNALIRFAFPGDAAKIEQTLNTLGLSKTVNSLTQKYTKAMGEAVVEAKPIFLNSVKRMSFTDVTGILLSNNHHAATEYFKSSMTNDLLAAFAPIVTKSINVNGGDKEYQTIAKAYNTFAFGGKKMETNLTDFISGRVIDAMFAYVGKEEENIRTNLSFRTTPLLQRVFGYVDQQKSLNNSSSRSGGILAN
ncbi:MAG: DUF4197 domain-containing protein [Chitinophagaceae bacterium]|nr:MAG: DUF4197 domain-containing protein [Chitinophagaceae bacterium]